MKKVDSGNGRRRLFRAGLSALAAGLLLKLVGSERVVVERVHGADGSAVIIGLANTGSSTTTLSSPVNDGPTAFFDNAGSGDAQGVQARTLAVNGRGLVGFHQQTSGSGIGVDGVSNSPDGIGLRGANTATTGQPIGVEGQTLSPTGAIFLGRGLGGVERIRIQQDGSIHFATATTLMISGGNSNFIAGSSVNAVNPGAVGATISGGGFFDGRENRVEGNWGTVSGGLDNRAGGGDTVGGGASNTASGSVSTVAGGSTNGAIGFASMIPGGVFNFAAGDYSFAAGRRAKALHSGAFVWGDSTDANFASTASNQFLVRAGGGVGINTTNPSGSLHVGGDAARPFVMDRSTVAAVAPGAGRGMLRWEQGTNPGTLKLVAYSGTTTAAFTIADNVGSGN